LSLVSAEKYGGDKRQPEIGLRSQATLSFAPITFISCLKSSSDLYLKLRFTNVNVNPTPTVEMMVENDNSASQLLPSPSQFGLHVLFLSGGPLLPFYCILQVFYLQQPCFGSFSLFISVGTLVICSTSSVADSLIM